METGSLEQWRERVSKQIATLPVVPEEFLKWNASVASLLGTTATLPRCIKLEESFYSSVGRSSSQLYDAVEIGMALLT